MWRLRWQWWHPLTCEKHLETMLFSFTLLVNLFSLTNGALLFNHFTMAPFTTWSARYLLLLLLIMHDHWSYINILLIGIFFPPILLLFIIDFFVLPNSLRCTAFCSLQVHNFLATFTYIYIFLYLFCVVPIYVVFLLCYKKLDFAFFFLFFRYKLRDVKVEERDQSNHREWVSPVLHMLGFLFLFFFFSNLQFSSSFFF